MEKRAVAINKVEGLLQLQNEVDKRLLIESDDIQNTYYLILINNVIRCGISYYDYGIKPNTIIDDMCLKMYIGFGKKFVCMDMQENSISYEKELSSIFYQLISNVNRSIICAVCELDIYCFNSEGMIWNIGFKNIINEYKIIDNCIISILCEDGEEYAFSLEKGDLMNLR